MASPPSPLENIFANLFQNPEEANRFQAAISAIAAQFTTPASAMATPAVTPAPATQPKPAQDAEVAEPSSSALVSFLNPKPLKVIEPIPTEGVAQEEDEEVPITASEAEPRKPKKKTRKATVTKVKMPEEKAPSRKRNRSDEKPKKKPTRRSDRIPRQARKSGPAPPVHVNLSDEEDSPPVKIQKGSGSKKSRVKVVDYSVTISDEASSSPAEETPVDEDEEFTEGEAADSTPTPPTKPEGRTRASKRAMASEEAEETPLSEVLKKMKRAQIRQGKRAVEDPVPTTAISTSEEDAEVELPEGPQIDPKEALYARLYSEASKVQCEMWEKEGWTAHGERYIDEPSFEAFNLIQFLHSRGLYKSVSATAPYSARTIRYAYSNIRTSAFGDPFSVQFGKVYMRRKVYNLLPSDINEELGLTYSGVVRTEEDMTEVTKVLTGGKEKIWKNPMKASSLTYLYSVLHKLMTFNWIVSKNNTVVTQSQAVLLYQIGLNRPFNLGQIIFHQIASLGTKKSNLSGFPFPSLIYRILTKQGFTESKNSREKLDVVKPYSLNATLLFSGQKVKDLPWVDPTAPKSSERPGVPITVDSTELENLLFKVEDMERVALNVYNNTMGDLILLRTALEELLSSQKGGESSTAAAPVEPTASKKEEQAEGEAKAEAEGEAKAEAEFGASEGSKTMDTSA